MKPALLLLSLLSLSLLSFSQPAPDTLWTRSYPDLGLSWPADAMITPEGDIVITGFHGMYPDSSLGWANLFVAKFDGEGNQLWYTEFSGEVDRGGNGQRTLHGG